MQDYILKGHQFLLQNLNLLMEYSIINANLLFELEYYIIQQLQVLSYLQNVH